MKLLILHFTMLFASISAFIMACSTAPITGRRQLDLVSSAQVAQMGDAAWQELRDKTPPVKDPKVEAFVKKTAERLLAATPGQNKGDKWDFAVFDSKEVNAFALPGGHIGVYSGMLAVAENEAGLATVLGHEIGHVIAHHPHERISQELVAQGALGLASSALGSSRYHNVLMSALGIGAQVGVLLPFSRNQESESDEIGLRIMAKSGYDPKEALAFWTRMKAKSQGDPPTFLSSHPATEDRIEQIKQLLPEAELAYAQAPIHRNSGERAPAGL